MSLSQSVPMVRCRLDGAEEDSLRALRYVPLADFEFWRHLMENRHRRQVTVEEVSVWVAEDPARWSSLGDVDALQPVLRVRFDAPGAEGVPRLVERFLPAETYPEAQEALLSHYAGQPSEELQATAGYFVPASSGSPASEPLLSA
jgi:hypothetical protein